MGQRINENTGEVVEVNIAKKAKPFIKETPTLPIEPSIGTIQDVDWQDRFRNYIGRYVSPLLTIGGGLAGEFAGAASPIPGGRAIGTGFGSFAGSLIGQALQSGDPKLFGGVERSPEEAVKQALWEGGINTVATPIMRGISYAPLLATKSGRQQLSEKFVQLFKSHATPEDIAAMQAHPDVPYSVGQATKNRVAMTLENIGAPIQKRELVETEENLLKDKFNALIPQGLTPETTATTVKGNLRSSYNIIKAKENAAWDDLKVKANTNVYNYKEVVGEKGSGVIDPTTGKETMVPVYQDFEVPGPIRVINTYTWLKQVTNELDRQYGVKSTADLVNIVEADLKPFARTANQVLTQAEIKDTAGNIVGIRPIPYQALQDLKASAGSRGFKNAINKTRVEASYASLNKIANKDIEESISDPTLGWTSDALKAFQAAKKLTIRRTALFGKKEAPANAALLGSTDSGVSALNRILGDSTAVQKAVAASGGNKKVLGGEVLSRIYQNSIDPKTGMFRPEVALEAFTNRDADEAMRKIFSASERADITNLFRVIKHTSEKPGMAGITGVFMRIGSAGITMMPTVPLALAAGGFPRTGLVAANVVGVALSANQFIKHVMLNPKLARKAAAGFTVSPLSPVAKGIQKSLMLAMRGEQVKLTAPNGVVIGEGRVNDSGQVVPNRILLDED